MRGRLPAAMRTSPRIALIAAFACSISLELLEVPNAAAQGRAKPHPAASAAARVTPPAPAGSLAAALDELERSDYAAAERDLTAATKGKDASEAWLALARLYQTTGKYPEAVDAADKAMRGKGQARLDGAAAKARAMAAQGKLTEAIAVLQPVKDEPDARRARLALGELLIESGKSADARDPLMTLVTDYNNDAIKSDDAVGLALVGRAVHLLRKPRDANDAYNQAERAGGARVETLMWRAELFLEKYDPGHAEEVLKEALKLSPNHPDAHVMMARVKLDQALDFDAAEAAIGRALAVNPRHAGAFAMRAGLGLRDFDLAAADAAIDQGLRTSGRDLMLLSMRASVRLLADDRGGFEAARKKVLDLNPEYSTLYQVIGEFADWEHRYVEIIGLMQEAVRVDPKDGKAWAVLGLNQIRIGNDADGVDALRKAWDLDKFNVRAFNTLNLFERDIPKIYETVEKGHFRFRFDKTERAVLERYVPQMLEEAFGSMVKRYGMTPTLPVGIELYSNTEHFSVRTSGLPNVGIQGVCFGSTLAASSPKGQPFNWGNVLWHELGHVFAIQQSKAHVPRWFTEGLSEYETFVRRPEWQREEDVALYTAMSAGRIPKLAHFNRAFTHVEDVGDVTMAYYAASQIVTYIGEHYGMPKIVEMLKLWGQGVRDTDVIQRVLGVSPEQLDNQFRAWLEPRFVRYRKQFVPDLHAPELDTAERAAKEAPGDLRKQIELALAAAEARDAEKFKAALDRATQLGPKDPHVRLLTAQQALRKKDAAGARKIFETMIQDHQDGYAVRMQLADLAEGAKDPKAMRAHLEAARRFDPSQVEALQALYDLSKKQDRKQDMIAALRDLSILDQHDQRVYGRLMKLLAEAGRWDELRAVGARAMFVDVHSPTVHALYGQALANGNEREKALYEYETALLCNPPKETLAAIHVEMAKLYKAVGQGEKAKASAAEALKIDPNNAQAKALSGM